MNKEFLLSSLTEQYPQFKNFDISVLKRSQANDLYMLMLDNDSFRQQFILKDYSGRSNAAEVIETQLTVEELIRRNTDVPVLVSLAMVNHQAGLYSIIQPKIPGITIKRLLQTDEENTVRPFVEQSAAVLAQIHNIKAENFGDVIKSGSHFKTWGDCFGSYVTQQLEIGIRNRIFTAPHADFFIQRIRNFDHTSLRTPTLQHGDFHSGNILVDINLGNIAGIIDFELARFWIPEWDITRCKQVAYPNNPRLADVFVKSYAENVGTSIDNLLEQVEFYRSFESLFFSVWGWKRNEELTQQIKQDIGEITGLPYSD